MKLTLPLPPNMANASVHWRTKNRQRKEYLTLCDYLRNPRPKWHSTRSGKLGPPPKVQITATLYHTHKSDPDGRMARIKWPVDWLTRNGYIVDDDDEHLVWAGVPTQVKCKKADRRVEFILEEVK